MLCRQVARPCSKSFFFLLNQPCTHRVHCSPGKNCGGRGNAPFGPHPSGHHLSGQKPAGPQPSLGPSQVWQSGVGPNRLIHWRQQVAAMADVAIPVMDIADPDPNLIGDGVDTLTRELQRAKPAVLMEAQSHSGVRPECFFTNLFVAVRSPKKVECVLAGSLANLIIESQQCGVDALKAQTPNTGG